MERGFYTRLPQIFLKLPEYEFNRLTELKANN
jgi:hypothetical protein